MHQRFNDLELELQKKYSLDRRSREYEAQISELVRDRDTQRQRVQRLEIDIQSSKSSDSQRDQQTLRVLALTDELEQSHRELEIYKVKLLELEREWARRVSDLEIETQRSLNEQNEAWRRRFDESIRRKDMEIEEVRHSFDIYRKSELDSEIRDLSLKFGEERERYDREIQAQKKRQEGLYADIETWKKKLSEMEFLLSESNKQQAELENMVNILNNDKLRLAQEVDFWMGKTHEVESQKIKELEELRERWEDQRRSRVETEKKAYAGQMEDIKIQLLRQSDENIFLKNRVNDLEIELQRRSGQETIVIEYMTRIVLMGSEIERLNSDVDAWRLRVKKKNIIEI
jgi:chromosome segregation ATPase